MAKLTRADRPRDLGPAWPGPIGRIMALRVRGLPVVASPGRAQYPAPPVLRMCLLVFVLALLVRTGPTLAHGLALFAAADRGGVAGQVSYAGGHPAGGLAVQVFAADGELRALLETDAEGHFVYRPSVAEDLRLVAQSADGHRAESRIDAAELAIAVDAAHPEAGSDASGPAAPCAASAELDASTVRAIEQVVARQVQPLRAAIAQSESRVRLQDVLGGIGYILGVTGLWLWWRSRRGRVRSAGETPG